VNWHEIACVIIEPIPANMGLIPLKPGFLEKLRKLTHESGALLILDEVISGFRVARGGAQELYGIQADLTTLGKIIGGGLPVGAFGGRADIMDMLAPNGPVYQAGTLSGNPLAMAAGIATLEELFQTVHTRSWSNSRRHCAVSGRSLYKGITRGSARCSARSSRTAKWWITLPPRRATRKRYARFFHAMLGRGVYLAPSQFEVGFMSLAHTEQDIEQTLRAAAEAAKAS